VRRAMNEETRSTASKRSRMSRAPRRTNESSVSKSHRALPLLITKVTYTARIDCSKRARPDKRGVERLDMRREVRRVDPFVRDTVLPRNEV
jgi:hypothetical protein